MTCFDDPAVEALEEFVDLPVVGACHPSLIHAPGRDSIRSTQNKVDMYGFSQMVKGIVSLDTEVLEVKKNLDLAQRAYEMTEELIKEHGIGAVIFGCTLMSRLKNDLSEKRSDNGYKVKVIEPLGVSICHLESMIRTK